MRRLSPPVLARSLAQMAAAGATHAVVEVSSRELSQQVLAGVTLDAVCITHVGRNHLDWHGSVENYRQAKRRIFEYLHADGVAILNADDPVSVRMLSELNQPALTFGTARRRPRSRREIIEQHVNEQIVRAVRPATIRSACGRRSSATITFTTASRPRPRRWRTASSCTTIARGLEAVDRLPGRMERVMCGQDFAVLVDAADSPESLRACLRAARHVTQRPVDLRVWRRRRLRNGRLARHGPRRRRDGRRGGRHQQLARLTTSHRACMELRSGFADRRKARVILDRDEAIAWALREAQRRRHGRDRRHGRTAATRRRITGTASIGSNDCGDCAGSSCADACRTADAASTTGRLNTSWISKLAIIDRCIARTLVRPWLIDRLVSCAHPTFQQIHRYTLRLHRRSREIAGFRAATLPGLEHKACRAMRFLGQPRVASASR